MSIKLPGDNINNDNEGNNEGLKPLRDHNAPVNINPSIPGLSNLMPIDKFNTEEETELVLAKQHEEFVLDPELHNKHFKNLSPTDLKIKDRRSTITYKMALETPYSRWIHLEKAIKEIVGNVQNHLNKKNLTEKTTVARKLRSGDVHDEMSRVIDNLAASELSVVRGATNEEEIDFVIASVRNEIIGFGPLEPIWLNPDVTEVMVNSAHDIYVQDQRGNHRVIGVRFRDQKHLSDFAQQVFATLDRPFNKQHAIADGSLADGSRINALHEDLAPEGPVITIRRFPDDGFSLMKLLKFNAISADVAVDLANYVHFKCSTIIIGGTNTGKALDNNTIIPTPLGFVRMGDLKVGDYVYDAHGHPTQVLNVFPQETSSCFSLSFNDGSEVVADSEHNWYVFDTVERRWLVLTTDELSMNLLNEMGEPRYLIEGVRDVVNYKEQEIPYDAYELGVWLALCNGEYRTKLNVPSDIASVIFEDREELETTLGHGFSDNSETTLMQFPHILESMEKHKSANGYDLTNIIMNSEKVRRDFLAGYFDIKGTANINATISAYEETWLAVQIVRMASSLGILASSKTLVTDKDDSKINLIQISPDTPNFVRGNKSDVVNYIYGTNDGLNRRYITAINPTFDVPTSCITVDNADSLYLFGDFYAVTHNTSMLNALSGVISSQERLVTVEDTLELRVPKSKHVVRALSKPANSSGKGGYGFRDLIKGALRMSPKRIIVGETRDSAAYEMLQSMITGHEGSLTTIHSNDAESGVRRITSLVAQSGEVTTDAALLMLADGADMFVVIKHYSEDNSRRMFGLYEIPSRVDYSGQHMTLSPIPLWEFVQTESTIGEDGRHKVQGYYEKKNDVSEELKRRHGLNVKKRLTLDDIFELSENSEEDIKDFYDKYDFENQRYNNEKPIVLSDEAQSIVNNVEKIKLNNIPLTMPKFTPVATTPLIEIENETIVDSPPVEDIIINELNEDSSDFSSKSAEQYNNLSDIPLESNLEVATSFIQNDELIGNEAILPQDELEINNSQNSIDNDTSGLVDINLDTDDEKETFIENDIDFNDVKNQENSEEFEITKEYEDKEESALIEAPVDDELKDSESNIFDRSPAFFNLPVKETIEDSNNENLLNDESLVSELTLDDSSEHLDETTEKESASTTKDEFEDMDPELKALLSPESVNDEDYTIFTSAPNLDDVIKNAELSNNNSLTNNDESEDLDDEYIDFDKLIRGESPSTDS